MHMYLCMYIYVCIHSFILCFFFYTFSLQFPVMKEANGFGFPALAICVWCVHFIVILVVRQ